jgi:hypothetical protein
MTGLEDFLNKKEDTIHDYLDPVDGSFQCQNKECDVITNEAFLDTSRTKIKWTCVNGHDSAVSI